MIKNYTEEIGKHSAALALTEIGLGSFLHSFSIPLSGHILSLNQIAILSRCSFKLNSTSPAIEISLITSALKSLSPAGKKLTPMLAISAQGLLYYVGISLFGINILGLVTASSLASLWAIIQPVLFVYLLFGKTSVEVTQYYVKELSKIFPSVEHWLLVTLTTFILAKCLASIFLSIVVIKMNDDSFEQYQKKLKLDFSTKKIQNSDRSKFVLALKDLMNPLFIFSFISTAVFFGASNAHFSQVLWALLRPVAIGYIFFYIIRVYPVEKFGKLLQRKGMTRLSESFEKAILRLKQ